MKHRKQWSENALWQALLPVIATGAKGYGASVKRAYQPTAQADTRKPTVYLHRVGTKNVGTQGKIEEIAPDGEKLFTHEVTYKETTFMLYARVPASTKESALTGTDLLDGVLGYMYGDAGLYAMRQAGVSLLAKQPAQEIAAENAEGHFEITYSAPLIVAYVHTVTVETPVITSITHKTYRV